MKRARHLRQARDRGKHTNCEIDAQRCEVHMWRNGRQSLGTLNAPRTSLGGGDMESDVMREREREREGDKSKRTAKPNIER
jgi:hypothetical protein